MSKVAAPIVVDLGKADRQDVDRLGEGSGPLHDDIREVMRLVGVRADTGGANRVLLAIVAVYAEEP